MKGQSQLLVERAVLQARQEADLLYNLVVRANATVLENDVQRGREHFLVGIYFAEAGGWGTGSTALGNAHVRRVVVLDTAVSQITAGAHER
jgi:hypothetical protein